MPSPDIGASRPKKCLGRTCDECSRRSPNKLQCDELRSQERTYLAKPRKEFYEARSRRCFDADCLAGCRSLPLPQPAKVQGGNSGIYESTAAIQPCRTRMDGRSAVAFPSHSAGHQACSL